MEQYSCCYLIPYIYIYIYIYVYIYLFSFAALQIRRHKIFLSIRNIGGAFDPFHPQVTPVLWSK